VPMSSPHAVNDPSTTSPARTFLAKCSMAPTAPAGARQLGSQVPRISRAASRSSLTPAVVAASVEINRLRQAATPLLKHTSTLGAAFRNLAEAESLHRRVHGSESTELLKGLAMCLVRAAAAELQRNTEDGAWYDVAPGLPPRGSLTGRPLAAARADLALGLLARCPMATLSVEDFRVLHQLQPSRLRQSPCTSRTDKLRV
jgi:hypothetical protein